MDIPVVVQIHSVMVYPDRARVGCLGEVDLPLGTQRLILDDLPLNLEVESVRAAGQGQARVRVLGVDVRLAHYIQTPAVPVQELERQIEQLEDQVKSWEDQRTALKGQLQHLDGLRNATEEYAWGLARGRTTVDQQAQLAQFLFGREGALRGELRELDGQQRELDRRLNKLRQELRALQSQRPRQRYQALIELEVLQPGAFQPSLSYIVHQAGWQPLYDIRLLETPGGKLLEVSYLAQVTQNTGQDWRGVTLSLSTARPALNQRLPELKPWYIDERKAVPLPRAEMATLAAAPAAPMATRSAKMAVADEAAEVAVAEVVESGLAVSYRVPGQTDIPSDGSPHKSLIQRFEWGPQVDYVTIPRQTGAVYRRAKVKNAGPSALLAGAVSLFVGDEFIGRNHLDYTPQGGEMELWLGVEDRITVSRELSRRDVNKQFLRDKRQLRYGYKIEVQNLLGAPAQVTVQDQIPVSRHEEIRVSLERLSPDSAERSQLNILEWKVTLASPEKQVITFEYNIEHPRSLEVSGLIE